MVVEGKDEDTNKGEERALRGLERADANSRELERVAEDRDGGR